MPRRVITRSEYDAITTVIASYPSRQVFKQLKLHFPDIDERTLWSIDNRNYTDKMKKNSYMLKLEQRFHQKIYQPFCDGVAMGDTNALLRIADKVDISPALVAKRLLEHKYFPPSSDPQAKNESPNPLPANPTVPVPPANPTIPVPPVNPTAPVPAVNLTAPVPAVNLTAPVPAVGAPAPATSLKSAEEHDISATAPACQTQNTQPITDSETSKSVVTFSEANLCRRRSAEKALGLINNYGLIYQVLINWRFSVDVSGTTVTHTAHLSFGSDTDLQLKATASSKRSAKVLASLEALKALRTERRFVTSSHRSAQSFNERLASFLDRQVAQECIDGESPGLLGNPELREGGYECGGGDKIGKEDPQSNSRLGSKKTVNNWLKRPDLIPDPVLSRHVSMCMANDTQYGPIAMALHSSVGHEYENLLVEEVQRRRLRYKDENVLRKQGYDKTPDIKLDVPISVNGKVVNWIESKASFCDFKIHKRYLDEQLWSYWNRFGTGMVIYWFGFIAELEFSTPGILMTDTFPDDIVTLQY